MKDDGMFLMAAHITKTESDDDWCFNLWRQKERYRILKLNLSNEKFCKTSDFFYYRNFFPRNVDVVLNDN